MLRYYAYYSVGGYKDFYLGSSEDDFESSYYFSLLPIWKERAEKENDTELAERVKTLSALPQITNMSIQNRCGFPPSGAVLFTHAGYKLIYEHLEGSVYALATRDIVSSDNDESGRQTPFSFVILADTEKDRKDLDLIASYASMNLRTFNEKISSSLQYDIQVNGLRFDRAVVNNWLRQVVAEQDYPEVFTVSEMVPVSEVPGKVALLMIPEGLTDEIAIREQSLEGKETVSVMEPEVLPIDTPKELCSRLHRHYTGIGSRQEAEKLRIKELAIAAGAGLLLGIMLTAIFC